MSTTLAFKIAKPGDYALVDSLNAATTVLGIHASPETFNSIYDIGILVEGCSNALIALCSPPLRKGASLPSPDSQSSRKQTFSPP
jgi:hypothetical protein